eukprot:scaffold1368_cov333-Pavlova_lutheri.AAC.29
MVLSPTCLCDGVGLPLRLPCLGHISSGFVRYVPPSFVRLQRRVVRRTRRSTKPESSSTTLGDASAPSSRRST